MDGVVLTRALVTLGKWEPGGAGVEPRVMTCLSGDQDGRVAMTIGATSNERALQSHPARLQLAGSLARSLDHRAL